MAPGAVGTDEPVSVLVDRLLERCRFGDAPRLSDGSVRCAISGGPDSLALLALAAAAGLTVEAVHVDHGLRAGSAAESDVVAAAAARFGARFRAERAVVVPGGDLEARARNARRAVLGPEALTGHTADDQAETVLNHLLRGTGLRGLAAMTPGGVHPLLGLRRSETHELCRRLGLRAVRDESNLDPRFVRNRVRHELLPLMGDISGRDPVPLLTRFADNARRSEDCLEALAEALDPTDTRGLQQEPAELVRRALRCWLRDDDHPPSQAEVERVLAVVRHEVAACELSGGRRVARSGGRLRMERISRVDDPDAFPG